MPTYEYVCTTPECGHRFELVQSFSDPSASECPVCGHRVRKVFGAVGVVFKGSGFYRTDSRNENKSALGSTESAKDSASGSSGESKSKDSSPTESASSNGSSASDSKSKAKSTEGSGSSAPSKSGSAPKAAAATT